MGCWYSRRVEREEPVIRSKARRRYMKQVVSSRQSFSFYHSLYLHSLRSTGAALLQFANVDDTNKKTITTTTTTTNHYNNHHHLPPPIAASPPPPPPPLSPSSSSWAPPSAPSPPPPPSWDFWDPFAPPSSIGADEESEEGATNVSESPRPPPPPPPPPPSSSKESSTSELAMVVVPRVRKDFSEIVRELDEYFLKAAQAGNRVSALLQVPDSRFDCHQQGMGKFGRYGRSLSPLGGGRSWGPNSRSSRGFTRFGRFKEDSGVLMGHTSTVEKLYAWEKKLYLEVKNFELFREEHEKRARLQRKYEVKGVDYVKIEQNKRKIERLESKMTVASQAIETTSSEIIRLRESELFPQLLELVNGLMCMWSSMYECHQVQTHIVQQLEYLTAAPSSNPTSDIHRQASHQLELEVDRWYSSFCNLVKSQRDYIHSLTGWLRLSLFQSYHLLEPLIQTQKPSSSNIYSLCEEWQLALDRVPDKVASEGIKSFLTVIHAIILQQGEEQKQKKRSESTFKELEKRVTELRSLESKYGPYSSAEGYGHLSTQGVPVVEKKKKVDALEAKVEEEKAKYEKSSGVTRAMTINNLQTVFPNVFQAMTGFSSVCMQAFEAVYNHQRGSSRADLKQLQN